ncbi:HTH-type transcriptional regulator GltR [Collibacillus ludicampi]|uniref:HTH-type transcriptional regulator GltR n=1 Tax=Collibacillus ludicampi TaxID=2771369 RepID=A0AAV4LC71_9BACL|nr:LysR family transcriptional regulator [Collibacillus ludicampi]GIM45294.1 HTH-type transcriptional regulator GltR [Collibacillus ludicampi]
MDIRDLTIFVAVAEELNITKAAKRLDYAQSNVTSRIQILETELGTTLFYRHQRGVTLTPSGELLLEYARKILHLCNEVKTSLQDHSKPKGPLRIGSMETTAAVRLPEILHEFRKNCPDVDLFLQTGPTEELIQSVLSYKLDGAFVAGPVNHPDIFQAGIVDEELVLVSNSWKSMREYLYKIRKSTLLVFREGCTYRSRLEQWLRAEGLIPEKTIEFDTLEAMLGCVTAGVGIALLPLSVIERSDLRGFISYHPISERYSRVTTIFIRRADTVMTPALTRFLWITKSLFSVQFGSTPTNHEGKAR